MKNKQCNPANRLKIDKPSRREDKPMGEKYWREMFWVARRQLKDYRHCRIELWIMRLAFVAAVLILGR